MAIFTCSHCGKPFERTPSRMKHERKFCSQSCYLAAAKAGEAGLAASAYRESLSVSRLRELLDYDEHTGIFTWRVDRQKPFAGSVAGTTMRKGGYIVIGIDGRTYLAQRLAWFYMKGTWPDGEIDHIDNRPDNNAWRNLRDVVHQVNMHNMRMETSSSVGLRGVDYHPQSGRYRARIGVDGKLRWLGWFETPEAAHAAYIRAKAELHPGFVAKAMNATPTITKKAMVMARKDTR